MKLYRYKGTLKHAEVYWHKLCFWSIDYNYDLELLLNSIIKCKCQLLCTFYNFHRIRQATKKKKKFPGFKRGKKDDKKIALKQLKGLFQSDSTNGAQAVDSGSDLDDTESPRESPKPSQNN